jgi:chemotaxis protein methyltransferase CheR
MLLREHFQELHGWQVKVLATDLSEAVLAKAREGRYSQFEVNRGLPAALLARWFKRQGMEWVLDERIRSAVELRQVNLIQPGPLPSADLILLRNVLIYFNSDTKRRILDRVRQALRPGGSLLLGSSETPLLLNEGFERVEIGRAACYRPRTS